MTFVPIVFAIVILSGCAALTTHNPQPFFTNADKIESGIQLQYAAKKQGYIHFGAKDDGDHWCSSSQLPFDGYSWTSDGPVLAINAQEGTISVGINHSSPVPVTLHELVDIGSDYKSVEIGTITLNGRQLPLMAELSESFQHIID